MVRPQLIITADDYGMSPLFNRGIEELASLGLITEVSVMIKRPYLEPRHLDALKVPIGLHLELKEGSSLQEITAQIHAFRKKFRELPAYLDGHQHQHLTAKNLPLILAVAKKFHLPIRSRYPEDRSLIKKSGISTSDNFISWHPTRISILQTHLVEAQRYSASELVVHPGYYDVHCSYPYNREREAEFGFLQSPPFQEMIAPFILTNYTTI